MTIWSPEIAAIDGPRYQAIAEALAADVASGRLQPGTKLPTHRDLAYRLGVTVGTVSRAYAEAQRKGLTTGEVGRGTYVLGARDDPAPTRNLVLDEDLAPDLIDLSLNLPVTGEAEAAFKTTLESLSRSEGLGPLLEYQPDHGIRRHRVAGRTWLGRYGVDAPAERIVVTNGAQHGMYAVFAAITRAGDSVVSEHLTYPGMKELADHLGLPLVGAAMDADGLIPDAVEEACRQHRPRVIYVMTNLQNPTTAVMPEARRRALAGIARRHGAFLVEDDVYGFLLDDAPPSLPEIAPDITFHITSLSKSVAPGLRVGYVAAPEGQVQRVAATVRTSCRMAGPLTAEIASRWIEDGTAERMADFQRAEVAARQKIAATILAGLEVDTHPDSSHLWLHLPEPWRAGEFAAQAREKKVIVLPASAFAVGREAPHAVRVCLGAVRERERVETGLRALTGVLSDPAHSRTGVI